MSALVSWWICMQFLSFPPIVCIRDMPIPPPPTWCPDTHLMHRHESSHSKGSPTHIHRRESDPALTQGPSTVWDMPWIFVARICKHGVNGREYRRLTSPLKGPSNPSEAGKLSPRALNEASELPVNLVNPLSRHSILQNERDVTVPPSHPPYVYSELL